MAQYALTNWFLDKTLKDERTLIRGLGDHRIGRRAAKKHRFKMADEPSTSIILDASWHASVEAL